MFSQSLLLSLIVLHMPEPQTNKKPESGYQGFTCSGIFTFFLPFHLLKVSMSLFFAWTLKHLHSSIHEYVFPPDMRFRIFYSSTQAYRLDFSIIVSANLSMVMIGAGSPRCNILRDTNSIMQQTHWGNLHFPRHKE